MPIIKAEPGIKSGFFSTEFWGRMALYGLAAYAMHQGYTAKDIADGAGALVDQAAKYRDIFVTIAALLAPLISELHYTKKRTELKKEALANVQNTIKEYTIK
jgi:hypothetical protein